MVMLVVVVMNTRIGRTVYDVCGHEAYRQKRRAPVDSDGGEIEY